MHTLLHSDPLVETHDNILTDEECKHFIKISKDHLQNALVSSDKEGVISSGRTGKNTWIAHDHDEVTLQVGQRIAKIVGLPLENAEKYQIIYYGKDQEYRRHYDSWDHNGSEKTLRCMKYGGARLVTALCYLNDVEEGGGTQMTSLDITVSPKKGRLLIFENTYKNTNTKHTLSEHCGMPVISGEKYAFNLWFKECNSKMLYSQFNSDYYTNTSLNVTPHKHCHNDDEVNIMLNCQLKEGRRRSGWVNLNKLPRLSKTLQGKKVNPEDTFENVNIVEYLPNVEHSKHFVAYDINTERGKKYTEKIGQRIYTILVALSDGIEITFPNTGETKVLAFNEIFMYKNTIDDTMARDPTREQVIINKGSTPAYLANIYIRGFR